MKKIVVLLLFLLLIIGVVMGIAWVAVDEFIEPTPADVEAADYFESSEDAVITTVDNLKISGWIANKGNDSTIVVLAHGNGGNRVNMIDRAVMLLNNGYSVFLYDARSHGESGGEKKTFGYMEAKDLTSIYKYISGKGYKNIGFIGFSLGGVSFLLSEANNNFEAAVIESPYTSISKAMEYRLENRFGALGVAAAPLLLWTAEYRLGINTDQISPDKTASGIRTPILFIGGGEDKRSSRSEILALYEKIPAPRDVWIIEDAGHEDFYEHDRKEYENRVVAFFDKYLSENGGTNL